MSIGRWAIAERESVGFLHDDDPYLKIGTGPPLVSVLGLSGEHDVPKGFDRRFALAHARPLARHFTVYVVNGKRGLQPGASMSDIAAHLANAIERDVGQPVFLDGSSTGGSVALQLAVDRPDLVRRLGVISAAHRLGPRARELQAEMARLIRAGEPRDAWAGVMTAMLPGRLRGPARRWLVWRSARWAPLTPPTCWSPWTPRTPSTWGPTCRGSAPPPWCRRQQGRLLHRRTFSRNRRGRPEREGACVPRLRAWARIHVHRHHPSRPRLMLAGLPVQGGR
jgi:pimeloyl-ACP methyl ester carboxylesterase